MRKELRKFRSAATSLQWHVMGDEAIYAIVPEFQAEAIIKGIGYKSTSMLLVKTLLATGELHLEDEVCPDCGRIVTKEEIRKQEIEKVQTILTQKFDPVDVIREVTMPLVKAWLASIECYMVEQGYRLPKWERPRWLK